MDLTQWVIEQHKEIVERSRIGVEGSISFNELNKRMAEYGGNYAWAITENAIAEHAYQRKLWGFEQWRSKLFVDIQNELPSGTAVKKIDAIIMTENNERWTKWHQELLDLEQQKKVREQFLKVWGSLKDIYVELARNMRSDYGRADSLSIKRPTQEKLEKIKRARRRANGSE